MLSIPFAEGDDVQSTNLGLRGAERSRVSLHKTKLARVEDAWLPPGWGYSTPLGSYPPDHSPLSRLFSWGVGSKQWLIDANWTVFISPGKEYPVGHPLPDTGDAALVLTPSPETLDEICRDARFAGGLLSSDAPRRSTMLLRLLTQHLLRFTAEADDPLRFDELVILTVREAIQAPAIPGRAGSRSKSVEHAKEVLHARMGEAVSLHDVAREVGVSPVYLTQEFRRHEGSPLYRYFQRLRLSRALVELPHCEDITALALDLGFSSHSHFTALFRNVFGLTPSEYRSTVGSWRSPIEAFIKHACATPSPASVALEMA